MRPGAQQEPSGLSPQAEQRRTGHKRGEGAGQQGVGIGGGAAGGVGAFGQVLAQVEQHTGDVDLHGASVAAGAAQGRGVGQVFGLGQAHEFRGYDGADGAGIDPSVGVAAHALVDGADVEAGAAADAVEGFAEGGVGQQAAAPVVHDDQVELFRAVLVGGAAGAGDHADIGGDALAGGGTGEQTEEHGQVGEGGDDFFHTGEADMDAGRGGAEASVAFVGDDGQGAGFGDEEVGAADAEVGVQELLAQGHSGDAGHFRDVFRVGYAQPVGEEPGYLGAGFVEGRGDQVGRGFAGELDDVFAQVGFKDGDALGFQDGVEAEFLGDHRLAFGDDADAAGAGDLGDDGVGLGGVGGEVDLPAGGGYIAFQHRQVVVQVGDGVFLDGAGLPAPGFPDGGGDFGHRFTAGAVKAAAGAAQSLAQLVVVDGGLRGGNELAGGYFSHRSAIG